LCRSNNTGHVPEKRSIRACLVKSGSTWNRPQNPSRAESIPRVGELSLPAQNRIWLHRFCILAHSNPLENTGVFHRTTARRTPLPRELLALVSLPRDDPPPLSRCRRQAPPHGKVRQLLILLPPSISSTTSFTPHSFSQLGFVKQRRRRRRRLRLILDSAPPGD
jgi:hypothetical protein